MIGKIPAQVLESLLERLPVEFSVVDAEDRVLAWDKHESRIFKRTTSVVGRNVRDCHPKKSLEYSSLKRREEAFGLSLCEFCLIDRSR